MMARKACNCSVQYTPIYFDHKIADEVSTFNKVLFTGAYPINTGGICEINPLIGGCDNIPQIQSLFGKNPCATTITLDSEVPCFPSFYKTISYTFHDTVVNNEKNIVVVLKEASSARGRKTRRNKRKIKKKTNKKRKIKKHKTRRT
jgi:hypothetical protein